MVRDDENMIYLFHAESVDLLDGMEEFLLFIQDGGVDNDHINSIFRAVHTIKGGAAIFKFQKLVDFSHVAESLLDKVRENKISIDSTMITLLLDVKDHISNMIDNIIQNDCKELYCDTTAQTTASLQSKLSHYMSDKEPREQIENIEKEVDEVHEQKIVEPTKEVSNETKVKQVTTLKIESNKIDKIINLLGEMVITTAGVKEHSTRINDKGLKDSVDSLYKILEELREASMKTRMVPIGNTFNRYKRVVRDLSIELDKNVELVIVGADTELDKTIIEKISDPIMHLVRNSLDHGLESKDDRKKYAKPTVATIVLSATHETGNIIIKVKDDGRGLDKEKILNKAIQSGLINKDDNISESEIYHLIFQAGFSTATKVSDISGRGVGLDVVKRNIEELRGSVDINSALGKGTTISIRLPLTLAIIEGFMVNISKQPYIIPSEMILECIELVDEYKEQIAENNFVKLRDHILPILDLRKFFGYDTTNNNKENIVIVYFGISRVGLIVDELLGEFQTVIKPMNKIFKNLKGIGGATILGDGKVSPILDIPVLLKYANEKYK